MVHPTGRRQLHSSQIQRAICVCPAHSLLVGHSQHLAHNDNWVPANQHPRICQESPAMRKLAPSTSAILLTHSSKSSSQLHARLQKPWAVLESVNRCEDELRTASATGKRSNGENVSCTAPGGYRVL